MAAAAGHHRGVSEPGALTELEREAVRLALREDEVGHDLTAESMVPEAASGRAVLLVKQPGVVSGLRVAAAVFAEVDPTVVFTPSAADGDRIESPRAVAEVRGPLRSLLAAERTAVNFVQRMSGIATLTARFVDAVRGTRAQVLATRKTAPGLRAFDLAAVRHGGGDVHRGSLAESVLVKANHVDATVGADASPRAWSFGGAIQGMMSLVRMRSTVEDIASEAGITHERSRRIRVGVEVRDDAELHDALLSGCDVVLLDNYSPERVADAVRRRDAMFPQSGRTPLLEASGGITLDNVRAYAETGVDRISVGALTHSAPALDISLSVRRP